MRFFILFAVSLLLGTQVAVAADGRDSKDTMPAFPSVDAAILSFMDKVSSQAASIAISKDGKLLHSRGYGWSDKAKTQPVAPETLFRVASVTKPITAALIRQAAREGKLSLDAKAFELLELKPVADSRLSDITIAQLLAHQGGWDREAAFDPMFHLDEIRKELSLTQPVTTDDVIRYMLNQPLQFGPGEKKAYSNFGYCILGRVLEKSTQKPFAECVEQMLCRPLETKDILLGCNASDKRDPREVWYPVEDDAFSLDVMDAHGGLIASTPALCRFLDAYWITGEPRKPGETADWTHFGSLPGTTAMVRQRIDGHNIAVLLNGRRDESFRDDNNLLKSVIDVAIDGDVKMP